MAPSDWGINYAAAGLVGASLVCTAAAFSLRLVDLSTPKGWLLYLYGGAMGAWVAHFYFGVSEEAWCVVIGMGWINFAKHGTGVSSVVIKGILSYYAEGTGGVS